MGTASTAGAGAKSESQGSTAATPFSVLTAKLHDLLSRTEHFEVMTTDYPTIPSGSGSSSSTHARSSASAMLNKQLRLRLVADDAGEGNEREGEQLAIPKTFRNMLVSIHAIANFKTLDDYLRPRIVMADRPRAPLVSATRVGRGSGGAAGSSSRGDAGAGSGAGSVTGSVGSSRSRHQHGRDSRRGEEEDDEASLRRRSGRRHHQSAPPPPPPENEGEAEGNDDGDDRDDNEHDQHEERDELLDQFRFSNAEDEEDDQGDDLGPDEDDLDGLDAIVDDFEDDLSDMGMPGPGPADRRDSAAVNVEVGSGGKVTAKREDGTKVATPRTSTPASSSRPTAAQGPLAGAGAP
ncbi:Ubiquitin fusion degradation protein 4, partial [Ascosphaera atra]